MPLWNIHHTPGVFGAEGKRRLASDITDHYERAGLPRFYVVTLFHEVRPENFYVGGRPVSLGVRMAVDHIARRNPDDGARRRTAEWIRGMLQPHLAQLDGLHWEFHVDETSRDLWMINGLVPPPPLSDAERRWAETNTTSDY
ncbi:tautomerase family protein [Streptomyces xanthochromogenes]|uniref:tautomerase family protein n=1 Tax=Streptomyces xanthochromogenes TaxID=67384 RepID=UPI00341750C9